MSRLPLCVDLDGTLVLTDTLHESLGLLLRRRPLDVLRIPGWLAAGGKARLKTELAARVLPDAALLPYRSDLLDRLRGERARGRRLYLATGAHSSIARAVAAHTGLFDGVFSTTAAVNLTGSAKARRLEQEFGARGFDYIGDSTADSAVDSSAAASERVPAPPSLAALLSLLRPHQWVKNILVFLPLLASHRFHEADRALRTGFAFTAFCALASTIYLINDLFDLESDRRHPDKRERPLAAGRVPVAAAVAGAAILAAAAALAAIPAGPAFGLPLAAYAVTAVAYSWWLKRNALVDVVTLAMLYTLRVIGGYEASGVEYSSWLLAVSLFLFLSLALLKRYSELSVHRESAGRGYQPEDIPFLQQAGISSGYLCALVLALYVESTRVVALYRRPFLLWIWCPLFLYYISRLWIEAGRGQMHTDPVVFALRDRALYAVAALGALVFLAASYS